MVIGWAVLLVLLLYIWADVREIAGAVKENKRELLRNSFGGRTSGNAPALQEEPAWKQESRPGSRTEKEETGRAPRQAALNESEEQVLKEVLTEFLG